jgi:hypothetical protein
VGFRQLAFFDVPGLGHNIPPADWFEKAIQFMDAPLSGRSRGNKGK